MTTKQSDNSSRSSTNTTVDGENRATDLLLQQQQDRQEGLRRLAKSRVFGFAAAAIGLATFFVSDEIAQLLWLIGIRVYEDLFSAISQVIGLILLVTAVISLTQSWYRYERVRTLSLEAETESKRDAVDEAFRRVRESMSLENLIYANRKLIDEYHSITKQQAEDSYKKSQLAMIAAFVLLVSGAVLAIRVDSTTSKIVVGSLTAIGSLLSGFISKTFLESQRRAISQLNYYFHQPLITSYLLAAERLINGMSGDSKDLVYMKIVDRLLTDELLLGTLDSQTTSDASGKKRSTRDTGSPKE